MAPTVSFMPIFVLNHASFREEQKGPPLGWNFHGEHGFVGRCEIDALRFRAVDGNARRLAQAGVVERHADLAGDVLGERVVEGGEAFLPAGGVGVQDAVPVAAVRAATP